MDEIYTSDGRRFQWNDHVFLEGFLNYPLEKRTGRLVQVRIGAGEFGSDIYFLRLRDGTLMTGENCLIIQVNDESFIHNFYICNRRPRPIIPDQPPHESDTPAHTYNIAGKHPETGFIIHKPKQPRSLRQSFAITITNPKP